MASTRFTNVERTPIPTKTPRGLRSACMMNEIFDKHANQYTRHTQRKNTHHNRPRRQEQRIPTQNEMNEQLDHHMNSVG